MKILPLSLFVALALVACDRRATQLPEESTTTDTTVATPPTPVTETPAETAATIPPPIVTESCDDLAGQAQIDCLERNRVRATPATPPPQGDGKPSPPTP